jgi:serine phosphatase RsbU (regulator of sigma subunit)
MSNTPIERRTSGAQRFPWIPVVVGVLVTLLLFGLGGWSSWGLYRGFAQLSRVELRLERLAGSIVHLDEVLTMSARMAATSGDPKWEARYRSYETQLDAAIKETAALAPDSLDASAAAQTDAANVKLVAMENRAFGLVRQHRLTEASQVLFSAGYEAEKRVYAEGMNKMTLSIQARIDQSMERYQHRAAVVIVVAIPAFVLLAIGWFGVLTRLRHHMTWRRTAEEELRESRRQIAARERELEIAASIQTSILPRDLAADRLEMSARMVPATEVGGDYYDVIPVEDGCWIGIGDVTGHGLDAGLIMLMVQSALAALVRQKPDGSPQEIVRLLNEVMFDNMRKRLGVKDHVTFSLVRYHTDGRLVFAGAHEEMILCAGVDGACELIDTPGAWLGGIPDVSPFTVDSRRQLAAGDLVLLYTDGMTEAMSPAGEPFGHDRLCGALAAARHLPLREVEEELLAAVRRWSPSQQVDDMTVVLFRYDGAVAAQAAA